MDWLFLALFFSGLYCLYLYLVKRPMPHIVAVRWTCAFGLLYLGVLYVAA